MEWNVFYYDINKQEIRTRNVFNHSGFRRDLKELCAQSLSKKEFNKQVMRTVQYYYWAKCEHEVIISEWPPRKYGDDCARKVDIYDQIMLNEPIFCNYVWEHRDELKNDDC